MYTHHTHTHACEKNTHIPVHTSWAHLHMCTKLKERSLNLRLGRGGAVISNESQVDLELARAVTDKSRQAGDSCLTLIHCVGRLTFRKKPFCFISTKSAWRCQLTQTQAMFSIPLMTQLCDLVRGTREAVATIGKSGHGPLPPRLSYESETERERERLNIYA